MALFRFAVAWEGKGAQRRSSVISNPYYADACIRSLAIFATLPLKPGWVVSVTITHERAANWQTL
jgi:hypothetical protein